MRPSAIMASSAIVALLIGLVILAYLPRTAAPVPPPRNPEGNQFPSSPPSSTTTAASRLRAVSAAGI